MKRNINKIANGHYDVLIIGGGINGAAIAHMASLNGLVVALLEKGDFANGTSSKSTKLVHGGLRYLENFDFFLVYEALHERHIQLKNAPHLVKPLGFIIPVYKTDQRPLWMMKLGVALYDMLSGQYVIEKHRSLTVDEVIDLIPEIKREGLTGGVMYYDAQMDDARLCLENVLSASERGADVANYVEVQSIIKENGKAVGVKALDLISREEFQVRAKKIVAAVGPWTNIFINQERSQAPQKIRTTKGIHIVYRRKISDHAMLIPTKSDGRIFFIIPWKNNSLIGTTDTDYKGNPDDVEVEEEDVEYLFNEAKRVFPHVEFVKEDIITTFAGLRPLISKEGSPSKLSRKHVIETSYSNVIYVMGGKYTTYRKIAQDVMPHLTKKALVDTKTHFFLYGSGEIEEEAKDIAEQYDMEEHIIVNLMDFYGTKYRNILSLVESDEKLKEPLYPESAVIKAQVVYSIQTEMAVKPDDVIERRLGLCYCDVDPDVYQENVNKAFNNVVNN